MRLTLRLALVFTAVLALVLFVSEATMIQRERDVLTAEIAHEAAIFSATLADLVSHAEPAAAQALTARLARDVGAPDPLRVSWHGPGDPVFDALGPELAAALREGRAGVVEVALVDGPWLAAWTPVGPPASPNGAVVVHRSLAGRDAFVAREIVAALLSILAATALTAIAASIAGRYLVGRRVDRLVEKTRQVARGDLDQPVQVGGHDELAMLAAALDEMSTDLARLRRLADSEARARSEAQRALHHADRLRTVGVLAAGLAHELGTPLNVIGGRASLLARRTDDERIQADAGIIAEQTRRITRLMALVLNFSRNAEPRLHELDLASLAADAVDLLSSTARARAVTLAADLPEGGVPVRADPDQIVQVVTNLVHNAIQATPEGTEVRVAVVSLPGGGARLTVEDRGPGVPPAQREQIFDPFFTTKPPGDGTGLGLSIVRRIVEDHRGVITVTDRADGPGARFGVDLPGGAA